MQSSFLIRLNYFLYILPYCEKICFLCTREPAEVFTKCPNMLWHAASQAGCGDLPTIYFEVHTVMHTAEDKSAAGIAAISASSPRQDDDDNGALSGHV